MFHSLDFRTMPGIGSPHLQMFVATFCPPGDEPPSHPLSIRLCDGDRLSCLISTPLLWRPLEGTVALLHGLGGSHLSPYMIRFSRKLYEKGFRVVRINLRGCGNGDGFNSKTYTSGDSQDIAAVLQLLKRGEPRSPIYLIGCSLGGNIILKMAGEMGEKAKDLVERMIAICPPLDIEQTLERTSTGTNRLYHNYYLKAILKQGKRFVGGQQIQSIQEFDEKITVPLWGYSSIQDYYAKCSSLFFIPEIRIPCDLLFAADDPFIDYTALNKVKLHSATKAFLTMSGAHMGFIGPEVSNPFWLDQYLVYWAQGSKTLSIT